MFGEKSDLAISLQGRRRRFGLRRTNRAVQRSRVLPLEGKRQNREKRRMDALEWLVKETWSRRTKFRNSFFLI